MSEGEKIVAKLIDGGKISGEDAIVLIKELKNSFLFAPAKRDYSCGINDWLYNKDVTTTSFVDSDNGRGKKVNVTYNVK